MAKFKFGDVITSHVDDVIIMFIDMSHGRTIEVGELGGIKCPAGADNGVMIGLTLENPKWSDGRGLDPLKTCWEPESIYERVDDE